MASDQQPVSVEWAADFRAAEHHSLDASLAATPSQRLAWLEQALAFAYKTGALTRTSADDVDDPPAR
ncbi:MAG: hypothetical protein ACJ74H_10145 [Thermoanaerobaculia bacterium]